MAPRYGKYFTIQDRRQIAINRLYAKSDAYANSLLHIVRQDLPSTRLKRKPPWLYEDQTFNLEIAWNEEWMSNCPVNHDLVVKTSYPDLTGHEIFGQKVIDVGVSTNVVTIY